MNAPLHGDDTSATDAAQVIAQLSPKWRVIESPPGWFGQWLLQRRQGAPGRKSTGWTNQSFCVSRQALERCVREFCGQVDPIARAVIDSLPEKYPSHARLDPETVRAVGGDRFPAPPIHEVA